MGRDLHDSTSSVPYGRRSLSSSERCGLSAHREIPCPAPVPLVSVRNCTVFLLISVCAPCFHAVRVGGTVYYGPRSTRAFIVCSAFVEPLKEIKMLKLLLFPPPQWSQTLLQRCRPFG